MEQKNEHVVLAAAGELPSCHGRDDMALVPLQQIVATVIVIRHCSCWR
jgi:hypothetical protein